VNIPIIPLPPLPISYWKVAGEAYIYQTVDDENTLTKVYHNGNSRGRRPTPKTGDDAAILLDLIELRNGVTPSQSWRISNCFSWPQELYGSSVDQIEGVKLKKASSDFEIEYGTIHGTQNSPQHLVYLGDALTRPIVTSAPYQPKDIDFGTRVEIAFELLLCMAVVWEMGFRYCDYSESNILWAYKPYPRVFVLDTEGCRRPGIIGNRSNGWLPRRELGNSIESDRSQCSRAVWRIIAGDMEKDPPSAPPHSFATKLEDGTVQLISQLWEFGDESTYVALVEDLRRYRKQEYVDNSFNEAVSTQFARLVLDYAPARPSSLQRDILVKAQKQFTLEQEILTLDPHSRRIKLNRTIPLVGFEFDIASEEKDFPQQQDFEKIRDLALMGEFELIADMFASLPDCIPLNRVATRAIQVAIFRCGVGTLSSIPTSPSNQRFEWSWPGASFVNSARIRIINKDGKVLNEAVAKRNLNRGGVALPIDDSYTDGSRIEISFGLTTKRGEHVFSPYGVSSPISVLSRRSGGISATSRPSIGLSDRPQQVIPPRPSVSISSFERESEKPQPKRDQANSGSTQPPRRRSFSAKIKGFFARILGHS
jgi:hypothetical protein